MQSLSHHSNLLLRVHYHTSMYTEGNLEYTVKKPDMILQYTLIYLEYTTQSLSVHQIYTYSESALSPYTENILSNDILQCTLLYA